MSQEIDYMSVLEDLEARKAKIEAAIAGIKLILGQGDEEAAAAVGGPLPRHDSEPTEVYPGIFHGLSISEAAKKYLSMMKKKQRTGAICTAILKGGIETTAKNFYSNVYSIMQRDKAFIKLGTAWALTEWHPTRQQPRVAKSKRGKRSKRGKARKGVNRKLELEGHSGPMLVKTGDASVDAAE